MPNGRLVRQALLAKPTGKPSRCQPRPRLSTCISELAWSRLGVEPAELSEVAVEREVFQVLLWIMSPQPSLKEWYLRQEIRCKIKFSYCYCCISVTMRPVDYLVHSHEAHGAIWVWDPWSNMNLKILVLGCGMLNCSCYIEKDKSPSHKPLKLQKWYLA